MLHFAGLKVITATATGSNYLFPCSYYTRPKSLTAMQLLPSPSSSTTATATWTRNHNLVATQHQHKTIFAQQPSTAFLMKPASTTASHHLGSGCDYSLLLMLLLQLLPVVVRQRFMVVGCRCSCCSRRLWLLTARSSVHMSRCGCRCCPYCCCLHHGSLLLQSLCKL